MCEAKMTRLLIIVTDTKIGKQFGGDHVTLLGTSVRFEIVGTFKKPNDSRVFFVHV